MNLMQRLWNASVRTRIFLRRRMPTNILLDKIRTRRGLRWGIPAMLLLGGGYIFAAAMCVTLIRNGWHESLYLLFALLLWNGFKFLWIGPVSLAILARARIRERCASASAQRAGNSATSGSSPDLKDASFTTR